jgi:hypothetical protein
MIQNIYPTGAGTCRIGDQFRTANWLTGSMVSILRQYFGSEDRITMEKARLLWSPAIEESQVHIDAVDNIKFQEGVKFPKILVDQEDQSFPKNVVGDLDNVEPEPGQSNYTVQTTSAFSIECWGLKKLESWAICDEVRFFITTYRQVIANAYCFNSIRPIKAMKPVKSKLYDDYWICRLIVEYDLEETWGVSREDLAVSGFSLSVTAQ